MESNKLNNTVSLNIEVVSIDPDHFYSSESEYEDSDCSDCEAETRKYADGIGQVEANISKNPEVQLTSEPQSSESQTVTDSAQLQPRIDERNANDTTSTADVPTPAMPAPDMPTLDMLKPDMLKPDMPTPDVPTPDVPTASEELDSQPLDEPVELIDGIFDFVTFNTDTDVALKEVEEDGKHFDLEAYVTDHSESPTSSSQETGTSSISYSPGNSVSPISPPQEIKSNNTKGNTTVSSIGFGKGQGKNFAALMKCYNKDKPVFQKSKEETENTVKSLAKSLKDNDLKAPKETDVKMAKEKNLKTNKEKDLKPVKCEEKAKEKQVKLVKVKDVKPIKIENVKPAKEKLVNEKDVKPIKIENVKPAKEKLVKVKDLKPANGQGVKLLKEEKVKPDRENKLKPAKDEVKPCKENKEQIGEKIIKKVKNNSRGQNIHSATQNSQNNAEDVNNNLDAFTKAIVASMVVAQRKPNLEKRRNSETRKKERNERLCHFKDHSLNFQKYLSGQREPPKVNVLQPLMAQDCSNRFPTLTNITIPKTTNAINIHSKMPSQQQQKMKTENCVPIVNADTVEFKAPPQPHQNVKIENCSPTRNTNTADTKTLQQQQQQNIKNENCAPTDHKEAPAGTRKISIHEYLNRKRSHESSNNGSDVGIDSNIPTKKRISINEYMKRRVVA